MPRSASVIRLAGWGAVLTASLLAVAFLLGLVFKEKRDVKGSLDVVNSTSRSERFVHALSSPTPRATQSVVQMAADAFGNAEIVQNFLENDRGAPEGLRSQVELHRQIATEGRDDDANMIEHRISDFFISLPYVDKALVGKGVVCSKSLCEVSGAFIASASTANGDVGLEALQRIDAEKLSEMGLEAALVSSFTGNPKTKREEFFIHFSRL